MSFLKKFDWSVKSIAKVIGIFLAGIISISILIALLHFSYKTLMNISQPILGIERDESASGDFFGGGTASSKSMGLMAPNSIIEPQPSYNSGTNAENFEVKSYYATINSKKLDDDCDIVADLKSREDVIFENTNRSEDNCYFRFKVKKESEQEILSFIEKMKPKNLSVNISSIKASVEGVENELEILTKKLQSIEQILTDAQTSYDQISMLATKQNDPETLAKIIDSKLNLIERLTNERMNIKAQIDNYNKMNSDQLDQLDFTFFDISINKDLILNWKDLKEDWKYQAKEMIQSINSAFQVITLNLLTYLFYFVAGVLYLFISVFLLKFVWFGVKRIWGRK